MSGTASQPPIPLSPTQDLSQQIAFINQNFISVNNRLQSFGYSNSITVTRAASTQSKSGDLSTGILNSPVYVCFAAVPLSSPAFIRSVPDYSSDTTSGVITRVLRTLYDPTTGVVRCFVEQPTSSPTYGLAETWTFTFYLLTQTSPS